MTFEEFKFLCWKLRYIDLESEQKRQHLRTWQQAYISHFCNSLLTFHIIETIPWQINREINLIQRSLHLTAMTLHNLHVMN